MLEGSVERRYGHDRAGGLHARGWPDIPRKPNTCAQIRHEVGRLTRLGRTVALLDVLKVEHGEGMIFVVAKSGRRVE